MAAEDGQHKVTGVETRKAASRRSAALFDDASDMAQEEAEPAARAARPPGRYSLNALIAAGVVGFILGRICGR